MNKAYIPEYPHLCEHLHVGNVTLRNRMVSAPMGFPDLTEDGCLTEGAIAFYENRAKGGAAVVTISEAAVDYVHGKSHGRLINLQNPGCLAGLTNAARAIKRHGALAGIEINHSGMLSEFDVAISERHGDGLEHWGPVDCVLPNGSRVKGMTKEMIEETLELYRKGAVLIKRAGFDMVMIHAGHGWLIHQFLSQNTNTRDDEYGGSLENRARLCVQIVDAVRSVVGKGFPIELRFSAMELAEGGITIPDAVEFAKLIESHVDILHVSAGGEPDFAVTHPPMFSEPGCNVKYAAEIKKHVSIPVATVGALGEPEQMEEIIASGKADIVCMARALLADPQLPNKVRQNRSDEILRCIRCFVCHAERMLTQTRVCAINPEIGREYEAKFARPASAPKHILVAGGGPGGMQFALTAAQRGHKVTLCEKSGELGGMLKSQFGIPFKAAFPKYVSTMARCMELAGVEIRLDTEVTPEFVREFAPDALIVAIGAKPVMPDIPGIEKAIPAAYLPGREKELGEKIVVLGGGQAGCESAVYLAGKGHKVTLVGRRQEPAADANPRHRPALLSELKSSARLMLGCSGKEIRNGGLVITDENGDEKLVEADSVVLACGMISLTETVDALRMTAPIVEVIGDCLKPDIIRGAAFRAYHAALDI